MFTNFLSPPRGVYLGGAVSSFLSVKFDDCNVLAFDALIARDKINTIHKLLHHYDQLHVVNRSDAMRYFLGRELAASFCVLFW